MSLDLEAYGNRVMSVNNPRTYGLGRNPGTAAIMAVGAKVAQETYNYLRPQAQQAVVKRIAKAAARGKKRLRPASKSAKAVIKKDGTGYKRLVKKRKIVKRKKKSLKARVSKLERERGTDSQLEYHKVYPFCMPVSTDGRVGLFEVNLLDTTLIETALAAFPNEADLEENTKNNTIRIKNVRYVIKLKNNTTANCRMASKVYKPNNDKTESILDDWREETIDRGLTVTNNVTDETVATATASLLPSRIQLVATETHYPVYSHVKAREWTPMGKQSVATFGPGDTMYLSGKFKDIWYKPEEKDQDAAVYFMNYDRRMLFKISGTMSHDDTNTTKVTPHSCAQLDAEFHVQFTVVIDNGLGQRNIVFSDANTITGISNPVHADNMRSGIEQCAVNVAGQSEHPVNDPV